MTTANEGASKPNFLDLKLNFKGRVERYVQTHCSYICNTLYTAGASLSLMLLHMYIVL